ncbi:MAG TPA: hypothetical protein VFB73_04835 [Chloroflexota bacterium]|nr:hypothetical protein [Chloroflexota bacterium]
MRRRPPEWFVLDHINPTRIWGPYPDRSAARAVAAARHGYVWPRTALNARFGPGRWQHLLAPPSAAELQDPTPEPGA